MSPIHIMQTPLSFIRNRASTDMDATRELGGGLIHSAKVALEKAINIKLKYFRVART
jgi:hypothetical protein